MKSLALGLCAAGMLTFAGFSFAQTPAEDIQASRHPNLAAAQHLIREAFEKVSAAQTENRYDMQGHARRAKELLAEASRELKLAAQAANGQERH